MPETKSISTKSFLRELIWRPGVATVLALYGLLQLVSNLVVWFGPTDQQSGQFLQLLNWRMWMALTPMLTILAVVLILRSAFRMISERDIVVNTAKELIGIKRDHESQMLELGKLFIQGSRLREQCRLEVLPFSHIEP